MNPRYGPVVEQCQKACVQGMPRYFWFGDRNRCTGSTDGASESSGRSCRHPFFVYPCAADRASRGRGRPFPDRFVAFTRDPRMSFGSTPVVAGCSPEPNRKGGPMPAPIALQLYTLREAAARDFEAAVRSGRRDRLPRRRTGRLPRAPPRRGGRGCSTTSGSRVCSAHLPLPAGGDPCPESLETAGSPRHRARDLRPRAGSVLLPRPHCRVVRSLQRGRSQLLRARLTPSASTTTGGSFSRSRESRRTGICCES